ncbi:MAG: DUF1272 domain-containing protein [Gammaproteobacteria bacterium]|nr:DUF1272 domain-containing protein [Gammaproteobacteria bacterium]MDH3767914.1 DUF1272 domain-containing protein [Gammaproteobacteria bacterium]
MALSMKSSCERCGQSLTHSDEAYICSYECTFCPACSSEMQNCPNCSGELVVRPTRAEAPANTDGYPA